jgi:hypothetical protein
MRIGEAMGLIKRLFLAFGAFKGRTKIGALEGGLIYNIHHSGVDAPRVQHFILQIVLVAWKMRIVSGFFQNLGFSFDDYTIMYHAAVRACPNMLINNKNLIATFILVDSFSNLGPGFRAYSQAVSGQTGSQRAQGLVTLMTSMVNDVMHYKANELSPIEKYPPLTK